MKGFVSLVADSYNEKSLWLCTDPRKSHQVSAETLRERHTPMCKPGSQRIFHGSYPHPGISNPGQRLLHAEDRTGAIVGDHMITQDRGLFVLQAVGRLGHRRTSAGTQFPDTQTTPWLIYDTENGFLKHINTDIIGSTHKQDGEMKHCSINQTVLLYDCVFFTEFTQV